MKHAGSENGFGEAVRYYRNARQLLARCKVHQDLYDDIKPVQEAFGTLWLAVDKAVKAALIQRGLTIREIPRSWEALRGKVAKHLAIHNGSLMKLLNATYDAVHLAGYYWGELHNPTMAKGAFDVARRLIETLSDRKIT